MTRDHYLLQWYDEQALDIATSVLAEFDVALSEYQRRTIRDAIYAAVIDAKSRAAREVAP